MEKADKRGKVDGTMSPPPSQAFTKLTLSQGRRKKRDDASVKKKEGRRSNHLINGATALTRVPVTAEKSGGETIATEVFKITLLSAFEDLKIKRAVDKVTLLILH